MPSGAALAGLIDYTVAIVTIGSVEGGAMLVIGEHDWFPILRIAIWALGLLTYLLGIRGMCRSLRRAPSISETVVTNQRWR